MKSFFTKSFTVALLLIAIVVACQDKIEISDIKLNQTTLSLPVGGTVTLKASVIPYSASDRMKWSTGNSAVATVESEDKVAVMSEGMVTAKAEGTAMITVSTKDGKFTATCTVTVINAEPEMIPVEGGTFTMGCTDGDCFENELPTHEVTLSSYHIAKYPVTQKQWKIIMGTNPSYYQGSDELPVERVNWNDIQTFITKLNALTGKNYRLPTEAEWEYAARGGNKSKGYKYSGSDDIDAVAWYRENSNSKTHPVGTKAPNELGIYDMSGNVLEWCNDWYGAYGNTSQTNPPGPTMGSTRVLRGGAYNAFLSCRVAFRINLPLESRYANVGFRLVLP